MRRAPTVWLLVVALGGAACAPGSPASPSAPPASATAASNEPVAAPGVDPLSDAFIRRHGHRATGPTRELSAVIEDVQSQPWSLYLEVSRQVGLDFGALEGASGRLLLTPIAAREPDAELILLVVEGRPVGAWISPGGGSSGVLRVGDPALR